MTPEEKLMENPYNEINDYFENTLPKTGKKISRYASLINPSLIIPKIKYKGRDIRTTISVMVLGPSGSGKTTFLELMKYFAYNSFEFQHITSAKIARELSEARQMTLIVNDMARVMKDQKVIKVIEGVIEEGKFVHTTMTSEYKSETDASLFGVSVPSDISSHISSGLLFRVIPVIVKHDLDEQKHVGKDITRHVGNELKESEITLKDIKDFYDKLRIIQAGKNVDNLPVSEFDITEEHRNILYSEWSGVLDKLEIDETTLWFRELLDGFRFLHCIAFLNYFNRKKERKDDRTCVLIPNNEDLDIAKKLMIEEILVKHDIVNLWEIKKKLAKVKKIGQ